MALRYVGRNTLACSHKPLMEFGLFSRWSLLLQPKPLSFDRGTGYVTSNVSCDHPRAFICGPVYLFWYSVYFPFMWGIVKKMR